MQNEQCSNGSAVTAEQIKTYLRNNQESTELTWLVDKDNEHTQVVLREQGFRYSGKREVDGKIMAVYKWFREQDGLYEGMGEFFDRRVEDYDLHMADLKGNYTDSFISLFKDLSRADEVINILDLGAGTGAELRYIFEKTPNAKITCVDIAEQMLAKLRELHPEHDGNIETVCASYLEMEFGEGTFDHIVACNTLHHLLSEDKERLYRNLRRWIKDGGCLFIQDYIAIDQEEEEAFRSDYLNLVADGTIDTNRIYHIDIPLTAEHESDLLTSAGFTCIRIESEGESGVLITAVAE